MATTTAQKQEKAAPVELPAAGSDDIVFESPHGRLIIYHGKTKIASFIDGVFKTSDAKIIELLRDHVLVQERTP